MNLYARAASILEGAEEEFRVLIQEAAAEGRYHDVLGLTGVVQRLSGLLDEAGFSQMQSGRGDSVPVGQTHVSVQRSPRDKPGRSGTTQVRPHRSQVIDQSTDSGYPRFLRQGDRLVKIGWSDRDEKEYEHKAPRSCAMAVAETLRKRLASDRSFSIADILPVYDSTGQEVPSYQVYLVVAWLRSLGLVQREGKNAYRSGDSNGSVPTFNELWKSLNSTDGE